MLNIGMQIIYMVGQCCKSNFDWIKDTCQLKKDFIKNYNEEIDEGYFLEVDVQYLEKLHELHNDLPFLPKRMKVEKFEKLVTNLYDKTDYVIHIRNIKQALNHSLVLKKVWGVIKLNQNAWLKPCIDMNTDLKKKKIILKNFFLIWWIIPFLEKLWTTCENIEIVNLSKQEEEENFLQNIF